MRKLCWVPLVVAVSVPMLASCGGGTTPVAATPTPEATPTPTPTPPPPKLSVIPPCALPASNPGASAVCTDPAPRLAAAVNAAIDRAINERPDLFDKNDFNGGPKVLKNDAYMTAVVAALGEAGLCGRIDPEGEIGVKNGNSFNEQWIILTSAYYVRRKYVGACAPATF